MAKLNRRQFMTLTGVGATGLAFGAVAWRVGGVWWKQPAASGRAVLSAHEVLISDAIAEALFPGDGLGAPSGLEVGLTAKLDHMMATTLKGDSADLLRVLMHAIDDGAALGSGWSRLHQRPLPERIEALRAWETSYIAGRRHAFGALKIMYSMGYCEDMAVIAALNIDYQCGDLTT